MSFELFNIDGAPERGVTGQHLFRALTCKSMRCTSPVMRVQTTPQHCTTTHPPASLGEIDTRVRPTFQIWSPQNGFWIINTLYWSPQNSHIDRAPITHKISRRQPPPSQPTTRSHCCNRDRRQHPHHKPPHAVTVCNVIVGSTPTTTSHRTQSLLQRDGSSVYPPVNLPVRFEKVGFSF